MSITVEEKSFHFALRIVILCKYLREEKKEFTLSKQLLRAGTSIGANTAEAQQAQSRLDFVNKMNIALKEAVETNYWLRLLHAAEYLSDTQFDSMISDCRELEKNAYFNHKNNEDPRLREQLHSYFYSSPKGIP